MTCETSSIVKLARQAIELHVRTGKTLHADVDTAKEINGKAGVFVSIKKKGSLRGCIGTFEPTCADIRQEVIQNAISAATRDPRFPSITPDELSDINISVDILTNPEPIPDITDLDPKRYGTIIKAGFRKGLLLPDLDGVDTAEQQIDICRQKAGIGTDEKVELFRFEVKRHK